VDPKQLKLNVYARYINVFVALFFASGIPMPADKNALLILSLAGLGVNAGLHLVAILTGRYRLVAFLLLGLDVATVIPAIYLTGFVASPFVIMLPISFNVFYYLSMSKRTTFFYGCAFVAAITAAFALWWHRTGGTEGWDPHQYPVFTFAVFGLLVTAVAILIHQSTYLPGPLIAELHRQETRMAEQRHRAELGGSLATIVHEIKNPLLGVRRHVESALTALEHRDRESREHVARFLREAVLETGRLENRLASVSTYARESPVALKRRPVAVRELVDRAVEFILMKHRGRISVARGVDRRITAECDPDAMHQVLVDLLDNAVKARVARRPVEIEVRVSVRDRAAVITVRDNGKGMPPEVLENLFRRFYSDWAGGAGLGLYLARRIMEAHGGRLEVNSTEGAGSTVVAWLPLKAREKLPTGRL